MKQMAQPKHQQLRVLNGPAAAPAVDPAPKFWNVATITDDEAELNIYGEIVSRRPVDWWTGEPIQGLFVSPEEFLEDLAQIKDKSKITVRINSVGGDLYTALGICNRLKEIKGETVAIIEGIAASAATIIAMGCDTIKAPAGSLFMVHEALMQLIGNFNHKALQEVNKRLEAANKAAAETYDSKTKLGVDTIRAAMAKETWMTGREAVDKGFVDELIEDNEPVMVMSADRSTITVNGLQMSLSGLHNMPTTIPVINSAQPPAPAPRAKAPADNANKSKGGNTIMTLEELKKQHPELVAQITNEATEAARAEAVKTERARLQAIEEIEATIGDAELIQAAKYGETACSAQELAFNAMKKQAQIGAKHITDTNDDFKASGAAGVTATPNAGNPTPKAAGGNKDEKQQIADAVAMIVGKEIKKED